MRSPGSSSNPKGTKGTFYETLKGKKEESGGKIEENWTKIGQETYKRSKDEDDRERQGFEQELKEETGNSPEIVSLSNSQAMDGHFVAQFVVRMKKMGQVTLQERPVRWTWNWWTQWFHTDLKLFSRSKTVLPPLESPPDSTGLENEVFSPNTHRPLLADMPSIEFLTDQVSNLDPESWPPPRPISQLLHFFDPEEGLSTSSSNQRANQPISSSQRMVLPLHRSPSEPIFGPSSHAASLRRPATSPRVHFAPSPTATPVRLSAHFYDPTTASAQFRRPSSVHAAPFLHVINSSDSFFVTNSPEVSQR